MVYNYLLDLYQLIDQRIEESRQLKVKALEGSSDEQYENGRLEVLEEFKAFLVKKYHGKLPRRLRTKTD